MLYEEQINQILNNSISLFSDIDPSNWAEKNRIMTTDVSPFPGKFTYDRTPYMREIVDCFSRFHPARIIVLKKGAQIGATATLIENAIGWIMAQNPGNILFLTGHSDLADEAVVRIDQMIDSCGLRKLIRPNVIKVKNSRTGDTNKTKEFPGGNLIAGSASNHKLLRQRSVRFGFIDDFDAAKMSSKESGSTRRMIEQRFAAYYDKMKLLYSSTPELKHTSNIEPVYLLGDQRKYNVPCPCCGEYIELCWEVDIEGTDSKEKGGITWKTDNHGKLIAKSVGYVCQKCGRFFDDSQKYEMNLAGEWVPTAEPSEEGYYSYHISSLYAPHGMYNWEHYVRQYLEANPPGEKQDQKLQQTFMNLVLGETFEQTGEAPKANDLQKNIRNYPVGTIPETLSIKDGNGKIVLLTCSCDLNGVEHDARLDYEIVAWSETGSSYSIKHGSIGTFIPMEGSKKKKEDRERFSYDRSKQNNVWKHLDTELSTVYTTDTGRRMKIFLTGIDSGHYSVYVYAYLDKTNFNCFALKGKDVEKYFKIGRDFPSYHIAKERANLYLVEVNRIKDDLAERIKLKWDGYGEAQPAGFMNFPSPSNGLYGFKNYFEHFEAEHRVIETKDGSPIDARWVKKNSAVQNHCWDLNVYQMALKDILVGIVKKDLPKDKKPLDFGWSHVVKIILGEKLGA
jgi:phage terminase large subunit GpA-like protein